MKKTSALLFLFTALLLWSSCSNDFELTAEWKDIPVVYGMLSPEQEVNYVRIEKVFLDPETSALTIAKNTDSLYYDNISVQLERVKAAEFIQLERVDGNDNLLPRDPGIFATDPNILYRFRLPNGEELQGGEEVRLIINRDDELEPATASTIMVDQVELVESQPNQNITWEYLRQQRISWRPGDNGVIFDVTMYINIDESVPGNPSEFDRKILEWPLARGLVREDFNSPRMTIEVLGEEFYRFLQSELDESSNGIIRIFRGIDLEVVAGGEELLEYIRLRQANTGITSSQILPTYTNVSDGLGIFTSRSVSRRTDLGISGVTRDSLIDGIYTRNLNFR